MTEYVYLNGDYVDIAKASIPVRTHAFLYGTAVFEGIRAYWNEEEKQFIGMKKKNNYTLSECLNTMKDWFVVQR